MQTPKPCLIISARSALAEELITLLMESFATALTEEDETTMSLAEPGRVRLTAGFEDLASRDRAADLLERSFRDAIKLERAEVLDDGWSTSWRDYFHPVILERLQVIAPWMEPPRQGLHTLVIDPGQAFGTGGHATTRLILKLIEKRAGSLPDDVLDVGTGSGALGIAALLLGAKSVLGLDVEQEAVDAALENAARNGVAGRFTAVLGRAADIEGRWPLVFANIQLAVFETDAADIASRVAAGGELLVSGLLAGQEAACAELFAGFEVTAQQEEEGWIALALRRTR